MIIIFNLILNKLRMINFKENLNFINDIFNLINLNI